MVLVLVRIDIFNTQLASQQFALSSWSLGLSPCKCHLSAGNDYGSTELNVTQGFSTHQPLTVYKNAWTQSDPRLPCQLTSQYYVAATYLAADVSFILVIKLSMMSS